MHPRLRGNLESKEKLIFLSLCCRPSLMLPSLCHVCVYVCICVCVKVCMRVYVCACVCAQPGPHITCECMKVLVCVRACARMHTYMNTRTREHTPSCTHEHTHTLSRTHACTRARAHTHTRTNARSHARLLDCTTPPTHTHAPELTALMDYPFIQLLHVHGATGFQCIPVCRKPPVLCGCVCVCVCVCMHIKHIRTHNHTCTYTHTQPH